MSLLGKLMDTMRLSSEDDEDDYYLDDDFEDEAPKKGLFSKRNNTEPEDEPEGQEKPKFLGRSNPKVVPMRRSMEVTRSNLLLWTTPEISVIIFSLEKQLYLIWKEFIWKPRSGSLISLPEQLIP